MLLAAGELSSDDDWGMLNMVGCQRVEPRGRLTESADFEAGAADTNAAAQSDWIKTEIKRICKRGYWKEKRKGRVLRSI